MHNVYINFTKTVKFNSAEHDELDAARDEIDGLVRQLEDKPGDLLAYEYRQLKALRLVSRILSHTEISK